MDDGLTPTTQTPKRRRQPRPGSGDADNLPIVRSTRRRKAAGGSSETGTAANRGATSSSTIDPAAATVKRSRKKAAVSSSSSADAAATTKKAARTKRKAADGSLGTTGFDNGEVVTGRTKSRARGAASTKQPSKDEAVGDVTGGDPDTTQGDLSSELLELYKKAMLQRQRDAGSEAAKASQAEGGLKIRVDKEQSEVLELRRAMQKEAELQQKSATAEQEERKVELNEGQQAVLSSVLEGKNVFFTGGAGTGKTATLLAILEALKRKYKSEYRSKVAITASTGIAATLIEGTTIHSVLGCGAPSEISQFFRIFSDPEKMAVLAALDVLVLDEASMISAEMFEAMELVFTEVRLRSIPGVLEELRRLRAAQTVGAPPITAAALLQSGKWKPTGARAQQLLERMLGKAFAGLQIIVSADFFQLPPILNRQGADLPFAFLNRGFAFQSPAWERCSFTTSILQQVFRQTDSWFVQTLDTIRKGEPHHRRNAMQELVDRCCRPLPVDASTPGAAGEKLEATLLASSNKSVDATNEIRLKELPMPLKVFKAVDHVWVDEGGVTFQRRVDTLRKLQQLERLDLQEQFKLGKAVERLERYRRHDFAAEILQSVEDIRKKRHAIRDLMQQLLARKDVRRMWRDLRKNQEEFYDEEDEPEELDLDDAGYVDGEEEEDQEQGLTEEEGRELQAALDPMGLLHMGEMIDANLDSGDAGRAFWFVIGYMQNFREGSPNALVQKELKKSFFFKDCQAADSLPLKVGAQVLLLRNLDMQSDSKAQLVNGSRGVVVGWDSHADLPQPRSFTDPDGTPFEERWDKQNPRQYPVVKFANGRQETIGPVIFHSPMGRSGFCVRVALPLKLAWALTIHKSQGMTLDLVRVDFAKIFADGQAYVALSRVRDWRGLEMINVNVNCAMVNDTVMQWYKALESGDEDEFDAESSSDDWETPPLWSKLSTEPQLWATANRSLDAKLKDSKLKGGRWDSRTRALALPPPLPRPLPSARRPSSHGALLSPQQLQRAAARQLPRTRLRLR